METILLIYIIQLAYELHIIHVRSTRFLMKRISTAQVVIGPRDNHVGKQKTKNKKHACASINIVLLNQACAHYTHLTHLHILYLQVQNIGFELPRTE